MITLQNFSNWCEMLLGESSDLTMGHMSMMNSVKPVQDTETTHLSVSSHIVNSSFTLHISILDFGLNEP